MQKQIKQSFFEPNIRELLWKLVSQWKAIIIVSLIFALVVPCAQYALETKTYKENASKEAAIMKEVQDNPAIVKDKINEVLSVLPNEDRMYIENMLRIDTWIEKRQDYLNNSRLINMNPYEMEKLSIGVRVFDAEDDSKLFAIGESYAKMFDDDKYIKMLADTIEPGINTEYVKELINITHVYNADNDAENASVVEVSMIVPDSVNHTDLTNTMEKAFKSYHSELNKQLPHKIELAYNNYISQDIYSSIESKKNDQLYWTNNLISYKKSMVSAMTEKQQEAYNSVKKIMDASKGIGEAAIEATAAPGFNLKMAVVGAVLGLFLYSFMYLFFASFKPVAATSKEAERYLGAKVLGTYYKTSEKKGLGSLFHSNFIMKKRVGHNIEPADQIRRITESVDRKLKKDGKNSLSIINLLEDDASTEIVNSIISREEPNGVKCEVVSKSEALDDSILSDNENAIIVMDNNINVNTAAKVVSLCEEYSMDLLGTVYVCAF